MKRAISLLVTCLITATLSTAQNSIVVDTVIQTSFCAGGNVVIPYSVPNGDYNFGNVFTAQISEDQDLICSFNTFTNPLDVGILPYWGGGFMLAQIPDSFTLGTYRLRIISSDPPDTSNISPNCVLITNLPGIIFNITANPSDDTVCTGDSVELAVFPLPVSYSWSTGETTPTIWVKTSGSYTVVARDTVGCETESDPIVVEFETCIGVEEQGEVLVDLGVQPIPASEKVEVVFTSKETGQVGVYVYNLLGEEVFAYQVEASYGVNRYPIDISSFESGLYLLKVGKGNSFQTVKMIKQ